MELKYSISREEFLKAARLNHGLNWHLFFYFSYVLLFAGICWYFYCAKVALASLPVWAVLFYFLMLKQSFNTAKQLVPSDETFDESVAMDDDSITFTTGGLSVIVPYENINKISKTTVFAVITSKAGVFTVPRAAFGGAEQEEKFISMLKERVLNV